MDPFDDLLDEPAISRARAGGKFQPKPKPRPRKGASATLTSTIISDSKEKTVTTTIIDAGAQTLQPADTVDNKLDNPISSSVVTTAEEFVKRNEDLFLGVPTLVDNTQSILVNPPSQAAATGQDVQSVDALPSELAVSHINGDWHLSFRQSETEADPVGLDVSDIFPEPRPIPSGPDAALSVDVGNGRPNSSGLDLDPLCDDLLDPAARKTKAGSKFQPKAKVRVGPNDTEDKAVRLTSSGLEAALYAQQVVTENELTDGDGVSGGTSKIMDNKQPLKENEGSFSDMRSLEFMKGSSQLVTGEDAGSVDAHAEFAASDRTSGWHSSIGIFSSEVDTMAFELEPFGDIFREAATGDGSNDARGSFSPLEMPAVLASNNNDTKGNFCSSVDSSVLRTCDAAEPHTSPDNGTAEDGISYRNTRAAIDGDFQTDNAGLETEFQEAGAFSGIETLDLMSEANIASGRHTGKFQPKPNMKTRKEKPSTGIPDPEVESTMHLQAPQLFSETGYIHEGSDPSFTAAYPSQDSSMRFDDFIPLDPASQIPINEGLRNLPESSNSDGHILGDILHPKDVPDIPTRDASSGKREASKASDPQKCKRTATAVEENDGGKSSRQLRKRVAFQPIDEADNEDDENGVFCTEPPSTSNIDEDQDQDGGYRVNNTSHKKRAPRKSKKPEPENGKSVRRHKRANEVEDQSTMQPRKRFSHTTRRNRRQVDKALLETPEDEIDPQKLSIRDLILLAEYKERSASKEAATSKTPPTNLRSYNSLNEESSYHGEEANASEQGRVSDDDQATYEVQPSEAVINYQSFMDKTPSTRWSKQDTELFYEEINTLFQLSEISKYLEKLPKISKYWHQRMAVRQFGTDFSMIQQLFPGRTRHQVKLKFKKEERQFPSRLSEALTGRAKDHSHFQLVIERLQQASQAEENSNVEETLDETGEEEVVELTTKAQEEEVAKPEKQEEAAVKDQEPDVAGADSPVKSDASDDDVFKWNQYKSDY